MILSKQYLDKFTKEVERLNKKLLAEEMEPITYSIKKIYVPFEEGFLFPHFQKKYDVEIHKDFVIPKCGKWTLVAIINHTDHIITKLDESVDVEKYRNSSFCDHCKSNRFRKTTIIIKDKDDQLMSVGTTCINDFFGYNLNMWLKKLSFYSIYGKESYSNSDEIGSKEVNGLSVSPYYRLSNILSIACALVRLYGYAPSSADASTKNDIFNVLNGRLIIEIKDEDREHADNICEWAKTIEDQETTYLSNIKQIAINEYCSERAFGYVVSMVPAYAKTFAKSEEKSEFVGIIGEKMNFANVKYITSYSFDSIYGLVYIHKFMDEKGNIIVWKTKNNIEKDATSFVAKIKNHTVYNDVKQTEVSYVKFSK